MRVTSSVMPLILGVIMLRYLRERKVYASFEQWVLASLVLFVQILVEAGDRILYHAKQEGRNRAWMSEQVAGGEDEIREDREDEPSDQIIDGLLVLAVPGCKSDNSFSFFALSKFNASNFSGRKSRWF